MSDRTIDRWISDFGDRRLVLTIGGRVFGGRPGESTLAVKNYSLTKDELVLEFGDTVRLVVSEPSGVRVSWREFVIPSCRRAVLTWSQSDGLAGDQINKSIRCVPNEAATGFVLTEREQSDGAETEEALEDARAAIRLLPVP